MSLRCRARAGLTPHILYLGPECTFAVNLQPCPLHFRYPLNGAMGGPPLVWALQRGEISLAPAGKRAMIPWIYSLQWLSYTGLPVKSSKTARAGQNFRRTAKNRDPTVFSYGNRKTSAGVWSGKEMQRLQLHSPTYNAINRCSNASSLYVWVHIRMSWWPTMNRRNEISVQMAHYLTPVEISGAWQRCGLMGVRRLNLDLHNHRYRTASSLSRARSWGRTCFHNWGRLFTAGKGPRLKKQLSNKHIPVTQHNPTRWQHFGRWN
jgi:hypothetical protein